MSGFVNFNNNGNVLSAGAEPQSVFSNIKNKITGINMSSFFIFLLVISLIGISYYIYTSFTKSNTNTVYKMNSEKKTVGSGSGSGSGSEAELLFFYVNWCPHCKTAKPAWEDVKAQYENKTINGYKIIFTEINCTEETAEVEQMMNKYSIEGFPTIKLIKDGQVIEYDAKPTKETLVQFLNTVL